ncbi:hypothetical protein HPB51_019478 [Rhipicephalus microplus]|uniref:Uncharacterized protein n=1 Tax=Rhipicephalus microplus TaxID=6941 RepID=A0A9J6DBN1_RHIMP|nr:hypothetical protein HPB51_019478 [Rhipicephalus microplus]
MSASALRVRRSPSSVIVNQITPTGPVTSEPRAVGVPEGIWGRKYVRRRPHNFGAEISRADELSFYARRTGLLLSLRVTGGEDSSGRCEDRRWTTSASSSDLEMDRLKGKRSARRAQNTKIIQEARISLHSAGIDIAKLTAVKQLLYCSNDELSQINEQYEQYIQTKRIEEEYTATTDYQDEALSKLAEIRCKLSQIERAQAGHALAASGESTAVMTFNHEAAARFMTPWLPQLLISTFKGDIA